MSIEYKWLQGEELAQLEPKLAEFGWASLNPNTSRAYAAFDDDTLIAFITLQLFPHVEPLFVAKEYRGTGLAEHLSDMMYDFLAEIKVRGFMCVADSPHAEKICIAKGMKRLESPVYVLIGGE